MSNESQQKPKQWMYKFAKWVSANMEHWKPGSIETEAIIVSELVDWLNEGML